MADAADTQKPAASDPTPPPDVVSLRFRSEPEGPVGEVAVKTTFFKFWQAAREWDSRMRNRNRWIGDESLYAEVAGLGRKRLGEWGVDEKALIGTARAEMVEVLESKLVRDPGVAKGIVGALFSGILHFATKVYSRMLAGQLRRMPWESLLVMAVKKYQNHERILVYRRIPQKESRRYEFDAAKLTVLFVESAPGALWNLYDWDLEYRAIATSVKGMPVHRERNRTLAEFTACVKELSPAVIHVSAIDGHQGFSVLQSQSPNGAEAPGESNANLPRDGVYFRDDSGKPKLETPENVAAAMCSGKLKPLLVTYNLYNSSARLAAETVDRGAAAAMGFQDFIDDTVAEIFFANLFGFWSARPGKALAEAFGEAVRELDPYVSRIRGSGVTLWTSELLLDDDKAIGWPARAEQITKGTGTGDGVPPVELDFDIETYPTLNYSVLHNGKKKMFETFRIYRFGGGPRTDVRVEINLNVGGHNFPFRESYSVRHHILDLTDKIAVGLTSALSRSLRESVRTTIFVRVTVGADDERYCKTFDVSLLAVDEWIDNQQSGIFLPSFVLPRDPVIPRIIAKAQGYLMAIADDAAQGFDGYQSCGEDDPAASLEPQTRAIWYALQHDFAIKYINPPPTFTLSSQRLRTPSETLNGGRGTCIDLALLLAACYEHIGLYPVVFLLSGHAFAGYWADEERRKEFRKTKYDPLTTLGEDAVLAMLKTEKPEDLAAESALAQVEWRYDSRRRAEIQLAVQNGELVAVEATYLTNGGSFSSACEVGETNLDASEGFDSMLDVSLAREHGVTPLPLASEEGA